MRLPRRGDVDLDRNAVTDNVACLSERLLGADDKDTTATWRDGRRRDSRRPPRPLSAAVRPCAGGARAGTHEASLTAGLGTEAPRMGRSGTEPTWRRRLRLVAPVGSMRDSGLLMVGCDPLPPEHGNAAKTSVHKNRAAPVHRHRDAEHPASSRADRCSRAQRRAVAPPRRHRAACPVGPARAVGRRARL